MLLTNLSLILSSLTIFPQTCLTNSSPPPTYPPWPSPETWASFNSTINGTLLATHPSAAVCHDPTYSSSLCAAAKTNWTSSPWRTSQPGGYSALIWELGHGRCYPWTRRSSPCSQGLVPALSVAAKSAEDVQAAVRFANPHDLKLAVKNTGHDHLGRSSTNYPALGIWTHNLKGRIWHASFLPRDAPEGTQGVPAVTLAAGEQWADVYADAETRGVQVAGGHARTVGAAGGYVLGGGHGPFAHFYGLAVDNLLEAEIITPGGERAVLNAYTDPEYFWAVRGGGGSSWGVLTSVTFRTHPAVASWQVGFAQFNTSSEEGFREVLKRCLRALPAVTEGGYTGYGATTARAQVQFLFSQPNASVETFERAFAPMAEIVEWGRENGVQGAVANVSFPSFGAYTDVFLSDPNIATNILDASRLLPKDVLLDKADELVETVLRFPDMSAGFNFIGHVNPTARPSTAVNSAWSTSHALLSLGVDWPWNASSRTILSKKRMLVDASEALGSIVGPEGGTYINEANPYEPDWEQVFWGDKYERLLKIKKRVDPQGRFGCNRCVGGDVVYGVQEP